MDFTLAHFSGPLDLLLYLVRRHEIDLRDIPIAQIAEQFQDAVCVMQELDIEMAGEFLVLAATLMEIKSKLLLPSDAEPAGEEADPRRELVRQLLEYRTFKDAAGRLEELADRQASRQPRIAPPEPTTPHGPPPVRPVEVWDLVSAFGRLMRETLALQPKQIVADETPQRVYRQQLRERLCGRGPIPFAEVFAPPHSRARLVGLFLGLLELIKRRKLRVEQAPPFGVILLEWVAPPDDDDEAVEDDAEEFT